MALRRWRRNCVAVLITVATFVAVLNPGAAGSRHVEMAPPPAPPIMAGGEGAPVFPRPSTPDVVAPALYSIGNPTAEEQLYLELINRARANPSAEGVRLAGMSDSDVLRSYQAFGVNLGLLQSQLAAIAPLPPLSMNGDLTGSARLHTQDMFANHFQGHNGTDGSTPQTRIANTGYFEDATSYSYGESIYSYAASVAHGFAALEVDWGGSAATGGMQSPPGHRENNHSARFSEVGIGVVLGSNQGVGPQLVTMDFGYRAPALTFVTGVVYQDRNSNHFYDLGEGVAGVTIRIAGANFYAVSAGSGGYSVPVPDNGTYTVSFSGGNLPSAQRSVTILNRNNAKLDYIATPTVAGDFNSDGFRDLVLHNAETAKTAIWNLRGNALIGSTFGPTIGTGWELASVADANLDGKPDYILFNARTGQTAIWYLNNATLLSGAYGPTVPPGWRLIAAADLNGDARPDYVLFHAASRQTAVWFLDRTRLIGSAAGRTLPVGWTLNDAADFNGDGKPDFLLINSSTGQTAIWYLNGATYSSSALGPTVPAGWTLCGAANFNTDQKPDYFLYQGATRKTAIWYLNGAAFTSSAWGPTLPVGYGLASP